MKLGEKIKKRRQECLLSQEELATHIGMDNTHISRVEAGERLPSVETTRYLSRALDIPFMELMVDRLAEQLEPQERIGYKMTLDKWREAARADRSNLTF
jgi:transcriptional regulator with XRE-family HTH domain